MGSTKVSALRARRDSSYACQIALLGLIASLGCRSVAYDATSGARLPFTSIARGSTSRILEPQALVIETPGAWATFWDRHAPGQAVPSVDFATEVVVAVLAGQCPTAGYAVDILAVEQGPDIATVVYRVSRPLPGALVAQVLTSPFHIVRLRRPGTPLRPERR